MEKSTAQDPENLSTTLAIIRLVVNVEILYIFHKIPTVDLTWQPVEHFHTLFL